MENPLGTSSLSMDGKCGKPMSLMIDPNDKGIGSFELMTFPTLRELISHIWLMTSSANSRG